MTYALRIHLSAQLFASPLLLSSDRSSLIEVRRGVICLHLRFLLAERVVGNRYGPS